MVAIASDQVVIFSKDGKRADGNSLLADIEVKEAANFTLLIGSNTALFEVPNPGHLGIEFNLVGFC